MKEILSSFGYNDIKGFYTIMLMGEFRNGLFNNQAFNPMTNNNSLNNAFDDCLADFNKIIEECNTARKLAEQVKESFK